MTAHAPTPAPLDAGSFARQLRAATGQDHRDAESAGLMSALTTAPLDRGLYADYLVQLFAVYAELEDPVDHLVDDREIGAFIRPELFRVASLTADLDVLVGHDWPDRVRVHPATTRYVNRLHQVAISWPGGYLAHHYTRYLGDLSGGVIIGSIIAQNIGADGPTGGAGTRFFQFSDIGDPTAFKAWYRGRLDAIEWSDDERARVIDEVRLAYRLNVELMADITTASGR